MAFVWWSRLFCRASRLSSQDLCVYWVLSWNSLPQLVSLLPRKHTHTNTHTHAETHTHRDTGERCPQMHKQVTSF